MIIYIKIRKVMCVFVLHNEHFNSYEMLGRFFSILQLKEFQITWANILFTIEHNINA